VLAGRVGNPGRLNHYLLPFGARIRGQDGQKDKGIMKLPWMKFFPADWIADLGHHPLEFEGAWIRICCHIQRRGSGGSLEMPLNQWSILLGIDETKCKTLLHYVTLSETGIVTECNGQIKVTCRRMEKEAGQQVAGYNRVKKYRMKRKCNANVTPGVTVQKLEVRSQTLESTKDLKDKNVCSERKKSSVSEPPVPRINFNFEKREWENLTERDIQEWSAAYPACGIELELTRMATWLIANPTKRKSNYRRFINIWLSRSQDKGGTK
jgi:hypothetical protein